MLLFLVECTGCSLSLHTALCKLWFVLCLQDEDHLKSRIQLIEVPADSLLGLEGDLESCVYFIATGKLKVFRHGGDIDVTPQVIANCSK